MCNHSQYPWPVKAPQLCCDKCPPGQHMIQRSSSSCAINCEPCTGYRYSDSYNVEMSCNVCRMCDKPNMEYESPCQKSSNAVCRCIEGYTCVDQECTGCFHVPGTIKSNTTDAVGYLVAIVLLCAVITVIVFLRCVRSKHVAVMRCTDQEEEACKPVQEMCGKCDRTGEV
uniref:tumor necrosis factor receptor superfamily member 5 isoform X2 n=1 Tax=Doryrhamphus excisus TaxID=161450 RepID=UPI0025ADBA4A|nr:tumor necrosis factor receptor superfamily member 5 isoform X2 [Doryrhamphus excisus]